MQIIRTSLTVLALVVLVVFSYLNWITVTVTVWSDLKLDTKLPVLIAIAYLAGLVPMWLWAKASGWHHRRRISHLENALAAATPSATMTATQLDAAASAAAGQAAPTPHTGQ